MSADAPPLVDPPGHIPNMHACMAYRACLTFTAESWVVFGKLFRKKELPAAAPRDWHAAEGKRCYAIGDVHGCKDELVELMEMIRADLAALPTKPTSVVFLGDLIDRGPDSRGVIEHVMGLSEPGVTVHVIGGNHEEMFVKGVRRDPSVLPSWLRYGGYAFCESYGIAPDALMGLDTESMRSLILRNVPKTHIDFLAQTAERVRFGDYLLVHAGINPAHTIDEQVSSDLRWIRDDFLSSPKDFGVMVIHGHTIADEIDEQPNRIGIDTGAYETGILSAIRLEGTDRVSFSTRGKAANS